MTEAELEANTAQLEELPLHTTENEKQVEVHEHTESGDVEAHVETIGGVYEEQSDRNEQSEEGNNKPPFQCLPSTKGRSGWGSWAASLLTNALQLDDDEDDNGPYMPANDSGIVQSQPAEVALPKDKSRIERGVETTEEEKDEDGESELGAYGQYLAGISGWGTGWVSGALNTAKQQSASAAEFLKRDLNEFATVVKKDTAGIASSTTKTLQTTLNVSDESVGKLKGDMSHFLGSVKSTLYSTTAQFYHTGESDDEYEAIRGRSGPNPTSIENTFESKMEALYKDTKTYTTNPLETEEYGKFCGSFKTDSVKSEISSLLISQSDVRLLYSQLVPSQVSHVDFWSRLWFKRTQLEAAVERKSELLSKVQTSLTGDLLDWGDDDDDDEEKEEEGNNDQVLQAETTTVKESEGNIIMSQAESNVMDVPDSSSETDEIEKNISGSVTSGQKDNSETLNVHIGDDSLNDGTPPDSSTSDEWEKDFEDCRS